MQRGFTLIELLIVIAILSLLVVTFVPDLLGFGKQGDITDTKARMLVLANGANAFQAIKGFYPPDDFRDPSDSKSKLKADNGINTGIESLVWSISQRYSGAIDLTENARWLSNTDGDQNGEVNPKLGTTERKEVMDSWRTPFAYFYKNMAKEQRVLPSWEGSVELTVKAWKNKEGRYVGINSFQIVSAGPDRVFNTEDDITYPERTP
jgi:prepilin-type N-terminal cleavage/methylation domain-containing protein